jgi:hypothetical protein
VKSSVIEAELASHAKRLDKINGSIDNTAAELSRVCEGLKSLTNDLKTRDAVSAALASKVAKAASAQVTKRAFYLGCLMFFVACAGLYLTARAAG